MFVGQWVLVHYDGEEYIEEHPGEATAISEQDLQVKMLCTNVADPGSGRKKRKKYIMQRTMLQSTLIHQRQLEAVDSLFSKNFNTLGLTMYANII